MGSAALLRGVVVWGVADQRFSPALLKPNRAPAFTRLQRGLGHSHGAQTDLAVRDRT